MRLPGAGSAAWLDGERTTVDVLSVDVRDPAFQAGIGLFETMALRGGRLLDREPHLARLTHSARRLSIVLPPPARLGEVLDEAAAAYREPGAWLKLVVTRAGRWFVFGGSMDPVEEGRAVTAIVLPWRRNPADPLTGIKTLNYAASVLGAEEARRRGVDEGIWLNTRGHLAEGSTSNLFVVQRGRLFTPGPRDGILPGVVRGRVVEAAGRLGLPVHEGKIRLRRLERASEAFLTSSLRGVRPLVRLAGRPLGSGMPGAVTRRIAAAVERLRGGPW